MRHLFTAISFACLILGSGFVVSAQEVIPADAIASPELARQEPAATGDRWVLLLCGLPGDEDFSERMLEAIQKIYSNAESTLGVSPDRIRVLAGDPTMAESLQELTGSVKVASAETVAELVGQVKSEISPADSLWVFVLGHADLQGRASRWNVTSTDPDQKTFAKWFQGIECREKVFWMTTPLSGFYIRNLSAPGTVVITATEADLEISATELPYALADILAGEESVEAAGDRDEDGQTSLLDLYLAVCHEVAQRYVRRIC